MTNNELFEKNGFVVLRKVLNSQTTELLATEFKLIKNAEQILSGLNEQDFLKHKSDTQVPNSYSKYGAFCFESLSLILKPILENVIGKELYPTYSYARIMGTGAIMERHKDRPSCQFSTTICLQEDTKIPYPLFIENYDKEVSSIILHAGDMIIYHGTQLDHWRQEFFGTEHIQTFLHYVDVNGPYKNYKYDKRLMLGLEK